MSINFLDLIKSQLTGGNNLSAISSLLGESDIATKAGLAAALPTILGSVIQKGATTDGASSLLNMIKSGGHDGSALNNIGSLLGGGDTTKSFLSGGGSLISSLLGSNAGAISSLLGNLTGMKGGAVSTMLNMAAPLIMGMIGKHASTTGLGASGLSNLLSTQAATVNAALPAGMGNLLGFSSSMNTNVNTPKVDIPSVDTGGFNFWPWLIGALALVGAFYAWKSCNPAVPEIPKVANVIEKAKDVTDAAVAKVAEMFKVTLPGGVALEAPKGSLEDRLVTFIQSKDSISKTLWFDFDRLTFETGKATLKTESAAQLANIAAILKAFPTVKVKVGGYTDNVGAEAANMALSTARAKTVAAELNKLGIVAGRMVPEGYGSQHPVASNATEEGKAQNRRISLRVTAK